MADQSVVLSVVNSGGTVVHGAITLLAYVLV
jgi:hypothetical protein